MKMLILIIGSVAIGLGLGSIPIIHENLHWNLWFIIPISGAVLGAGLGWLQFWGAYALNLRISSGLIWIFAFTAIVAYASTELGYFLFASTPVEGVAGVPDGDYRVKDLVSFREFIAFTLESTSYEGRRSIDYEYGSAATKLTYIADLAGCLLGAAGILWMVAAQYPYCENCRKYKKRDTQFEVMLSAGDKATELVNRLHELTVAGNYRELSSFLGNLNQYEEETGEVRIAADQRYCDACEEATILGRVFEASIDRWDEIHELAFRLDSAPGEHQVLG